MTHGKFQTSVLCLLHMDTNLPSGFPAFSPSSLQSMWPVSKRVHLFKYCSAPLTYSEPPCGSPLPREARSPFCTCRRKRQPTPVFLPGESHGRKSLAGYGPWACKELDTTEHTHTHACAHTRTHTHTHARVGTWLENLCKGMPEGQLGSCLGSKGCFCYHQDLWRRHSPAISYNFPSPAGYSMRAANAWPHLSQPKHHRYASQPPTQTPQVQFRPYAIFLENPGRGA